MVCGSMILDKSGCLSAPPKSPASTAGYSTPAVGLTPSVTPSIISDGTRDEALVLNKVTWKYPLTTSQEVARISRAICHNNALLVDRSRGQLPVFAWRMFQACDRGYNGFIIAEDVNSVLSSAGSPGAQNSLVFQHDSADPVMLWDLMIWWRSLKHSPGPRQVIERYLLNDIVVPSDGLWAGVGLNATIRVWKNTCRCVGYLFRYHAETSLSRPFHSIREVHGRVDIVQYLIHEALLRISERALSLWEDLLASLDLSASTPTFLGTSLPHKYGFAGIDSIHFVDFLELLLQRENGLGKLSVNISSFPGSRDPPKGFKDYFKALFRPLRRRSVRRSALLSEASSLSAKQEILRFLIRQYLDIEQWRGQFSSTLDIKDD